MGRLKALLVLLLTFAVLVAGLFLPTVVSGLADRAVEGQIYREPIQSVELELVPDDQRASADLLQRLSWYGGGYYFHTAEENLTMTEDQARQALEKGLRRYNEAGILPDFDPSVYEVQPFIMIDQENPENYFFFWNASFVNGNKPYDSVFLQIDDATGKIIYIQLNNESEMEVTKENQRILLEKVTDVYFTGLGLTGLGYRELQKSGNEKVSVVENELEWGTTCLEYTFRDSAYGEFRMEFYAIGVDSFYIFFPE